MPYFQENPFQIDMLSELVSKMSLVELLVETIIKCLYVCIAVSLK